MKSVYIKVIPLLFIIIIFSSCNYDMDFINSGANLKYLENKNGDRARDCDNSLIPYRSNGVKDFWKRNNLPEGTTEFVCKDGKAYLPGQVPND